MKTIKTQQGSDDWLNLRKKYITASEVSAIFGNGYKTINQLASEKITGITPKIDENTQAIFDKGHRLEAQARPKIEELIGKDLYPVVSASSDALLMASFDGITLDSKIIWEHKTYNKSKVADLEKGIIPKKDYWQIIQQLYISGADYCVYTLSNDDVIFNAVILPISCLDSVVFDDYCLEKNIEKTLIEKHCDVIVGLNLDFDDEITKLKNEVYNFIDDIENLQITKATGFLHSQLEKVKALKIEIKEKQTQLKIAETELFNLMDKESLANIDGEDITVRQQVRKGSYDYKKYINDNNFKIGDNYKKDDTIYRVIRF
jgi:putative phage-type endonuclease